MMEFEEEEEAAAGCVVFRGCHLPPGFRFQPTDQEIIVYYLKKKIAATAASLTSIIADVDIYKLDPWELPDKAAAMLGDGEWFFFTPRDRKYPNGARPNRTAGSGYWKATGTDKPILASGGAHCLGVKKALVFYQGRSPKGTKTEWVMHEYRLLDTDRPPNNNDSMRLDDWVLCRVLRRKGGGGGGGGGLLLPLDDTTTRTRGNNNDSTAACAAAAAHIYSSPTAPAFHYHHQFADDAGHERSMVPGPCADDDTSTALVSSVLESIKRNLSFQAIDELYLLQPPRKRANIRSGAHDDDQHYMSPTDDFF